MMSEEILEQINQFRRTAATMGDAALEAVGRGDAGLARAAARQAAQYARLAIQLEDEGKQVEAGEALNTRSAEGSPNESILV